MGMLKMNLFFVVASVALIATVVSAKDQRGLRGGQHRDLEVHNEQTDASEYFEGSEEEEEFLSLEEREEMGLDAEDRDLAYNGYGNGNRSPFYDGVFGSGYGGYGYGSGYGSSGYGSSGYGGYGYGSGYGSSG